MVTRAKRPFWAHWPQLVSRLHCLDTLLVQALLFFLSVLESWDHNNLPRILPLSSPVSFSERYVSHWSKFLSVLIFCSGVISLSRGWLMEAPSSVYLPIFPLKIQGSEPPTLQKVVIFLLVEIQINRLTSQVEFMCVQNGLTDIQLTSRDQMKQGPLLCCHLACTYLLLNLIIFFLAKNRHCEDQNVKMFIWQFSPSCKYVYYI